MLAPRIPSSYVEYPVQVGDVDGQRKLVQIRRGKGHKDRFIPLPDLTYQALRARWSKHRNHAPA